MSPVAVHGTREPRGQPRTAREPVRHSDHHVADAVAGVKCRSMCGVRGMTSSFTYGRASWRRMPRGGPARPGEALNRWWSLGPDGELSEALGRRGVKARARAREATGLPGLAHHDARNAMRPRGSRGSCQPLGPLVSTPGPLGRRPSWSSRTARLASAPAFRPPAAHARTDLGHVHDADGRGDRCHGLLRAIISLIQRAPMTRAPARPQLHRLRDGRVDAIHGPRTSAGPGSCRVTSDCVRRRRRPNRVAHSPGCHHRCADGPD